MSCLGLLYLISISSFALQLGNKQKNKIYFNKGEHKIYLQLHYLHPRASHLLREEAIRREKRPFIKKGGRSSREGETVCQGKEEAVH